MLLAAPLGLVTGYILTSQLPSWRWAFTLFGCNSISLGMLFLTIPSHYINIDLAFDLLEKEKVKRLNKAMSKATGGIGGTRTPSEKEYTPRKEQEPEISYIENIHNNQP